MTRTRLVARLCALALTTGALLATGTSTAGAADAIDGPLTAGDSLYPNQGNGGYDATHYDIDLDVDVNIASTANTPATTRFTEASATMTAKTTGAPLRSFGMDFQGSAGALALSTLTVGSVTVNGAPATFRRIESTTSSAATDNHKLIITPSAPVDGAFTTVVTYSGIPVARTDHDGSKNGWMPSYDGASFVNQPVGAMTAIPVNNTNRDKATWTFSVEIPTTLTTSSTSSPGPRPAAAVSNGDLVSRTPVDGDRTRWVWNQAKPMAPSASLISIGRYDMTHHDLTLASGRTLPAWSFVDPSLSASDRSTISVTRSHLPELLDYFESSYGPYPGTSTGLVVDGREVPVGSVDSQDRAFYTGSVTLGTVAHNLVHSWFGTSVTHADWNDLWLNEGLAQMAERDVAYYATGSTTTPSETTHYNSWNTSASTSSLWTSPHATKRVDDPLFNSAMYTRGAVTQEALRTAIGVDAWRELMQQWVARNQGTSRTTADFIALAKEVSGHDLDAFFDAWTYGTTKPAWPAKHTVTVTAPTAPVIPGNTVQFSVRDVNTGRVQQVGSVIAIDLADVLDDATLVELPANTTLSGTTLTWQVPSIGPGAFALLDVRVAVRDDALNSRLAATARTVTLGGTCGRCDASVIVGRGAVEAGSNPVITGTPTIGVPLTATSSGWAPGTTLSYRWMTSVGNTPIKGATGPTFVPSVEQLGQFLRVEVVGSQQGQEPVTLLSGITPAVTRGTQTVDPSTITGEPRVGSTLTARPNGWLPGTYFTYQWILFDPSTNTSTSISSANGGTAPTFTPTADQLGKRLHVNITGSRAGYTSTLSGSSYTAVVLASAQTSTPTPTLSGTPRADTEVTGVPGTWDEGTTLTYQWSLDGEAISDATGLTYTPTAEQIGQDLTFTVTSTRAGYETVSRTSAAAEVLPTAQVLTPTPEVTGTPQVGQTLTADPGTWDDGTEQTYQWFAGDAAVEDATDTTFVPTAAQVGSTLTFVVTSTRQHHETVTRRSGATDPVTVGTQSATPTPTISGTPKVGVELTATAGAWDEGVELAYQWFADGDPIDDATDTTFTPGPAQAGQVVVVSVTGTRDGYASVTRSSDPTDVVADGDLTDTPTPMISGTPKVGVQLTAETGTWDDGVGFTYQWLADGEEIDGAEGSAFTPTADEVGQAISVAVTGAKTGYTSVTKTSDETGEVAEGDLVTTPRPTVTGTAQVGQELAADAGTWDDGTTFTYQWFADGDPIADATATTFTLTPDQLDQTVTVRVTGTKAGHTPVTTESDPTAAVVAAELTDTPKPTISGTPKVEVELTATAGSWDDGVELAYQWYADGLAVDGADTTSFTPTAAQVDQALTVRVTGTKRGFTTVTTESDPTVAVASGDLERALTARVCRNARVGLTLEACRGFWDPEVAFTYQWLRDGVPIRGATSKLYTMTAADYHRRVNVVITASRPGYVSQTATSTRRFVLSGTLVKLPKPVITGTVKAGRTLAVRSATYDAGTTRAYRWYVGSKQVSTRSTLKLSSSHVGQRVKVVVVVSKPGYRSASLTSSSTGPVAR